MREILDCDVAIVGGGIVGGSAALFLRRMGLSVTLLERDWCGAKASGVNFGGVRRQGRPLEQLPLSQRAHAIWGRLPELIGTDAEYIRSGHLKLARSAPDLQALIDYRERSAGFGLDLEIVEGEAFRRRFPALGDRALGGSLCPEDGHANPRLVSPAFARAAAALGAVVREQTPVDRVERDDAGRFVLLSGEGLEVRATHLLNTAGAWSRRVADAFGEPVPLVSLHPNMAVTEPLPRFLDVNIGVEGGGVYGRQVPRGNMVVGGGRGFALDPDRARPQRDAMLSLMHDAAELFPQIRHAHVIRCWTGVEGYTPDRNPVIGPSRTTPNLFHAFGFSGAGFQIGPAVGEALAELIRDGRSSAPLDAFRIDRFPPTTITTP
ncbi:NAD(P)/FAD-dependent oxidoreductase [Azospirillum doebereinerae]|uniref:FAD-binding oxidoreductase n=1 Tax=Azospirillum doebereinerae TaxID=92933 RepID=A0A433J607_9PROT|nr:FAD-binding oxidoreductase [Azospirillum doebereinerae]RUQ68161.1 FAD-binding oxidoreductase [Azospirillum doebereinerae]